MSPNVSSVSPSPILNFPASVTEVTGEDILAARVERLLTFCCGACAEECVRVDIRICELPARKVPITSREAFCHRMNIDERSTLIKAVWMAVVVHLARDPRRDGLGAGGARGRHACRLVLDRSSNADDLKVV